MDMLQSMNNAIDYIETNILKDINIKDTAKAAGCSQWYLQRMFMSITDVSVADYVRRRRLTLAAFDLQNSDDSIINIALKYGYQSPDSFGRAFKVMHAVTPTQARKEGTKLKAYGRITFILSIKGVTAMNYKIETKDPVRVVGVKKWFSTVDNQQMKEIPNMWDEFPNDKSKVLYELNGNNVLLGVCADMYDNGFDYWVCTQTDKPCPEGMEEMTIPEATWAIFEVTGPIRPLPNSMQEVWGRIYSEWLPNSGYVHAEIPEIEYYRGEDMMAADYHSEVWIPVIKKA